MKIVMKSKLFENQQPNIVKICQGA